jgi:hypothetical protein
VRTAPRLDLYDVACLAGGPSRVVDTALVALVESGRVLVTSPGELATVSLVRRHPVEAAVLDAIGPAGHRSAETVRWRLTVDARVLDVGRRLREAGLLGLGLVPTSRRGRSHLAPTHAGRHLLHELRETPPADHVAPGTSAMAVALHGRQHMPDQAVRRAIFEQPPSRITLETGARAPHALDHAEGLHAARRASEEARATAGRHVGYTGSGM